MYGILHSPDFRSEYGTALEKLGPRVPILDGGADFVAYSTAGRQLADLHLEYEDAPIYTLDTAYAAGFDPSTPAAFTVHRMRLPRR